VLLRSSSKARQPKTRLTLLQSAVHGENTRFLVQTSFRKVNKGSNFLDGDTKPPSVKVECWFFVAAILISLQGLGLGLNPARERRVRKALGPKE
jgi:hypothetical protein